MTIPLKVNPQTNPSHFDLMNFLPCLLFSNILPNDKIVLVLHRTLCNKFDWLAMVFPAWFFHYYCHCFSSHNLPFLIQCLPPTHTQHITLPQPVHFHLLHPP